MVVFFLKMNEDILPLKLKYLNYNNEFIYKIERIKIEKELNYNVLVSLIRKLFDINELWNITIDYNDDGDNYRIEDQKTLNNAIFLSKDKYSKTLALIIHTTPNIKKLFNRIMEYSCFLLNMIAKTIFFILDVIAEAISFIFPSRILIRLYIFISLCMLMLIPFLTTKCRLDNTTCDVVGLHSSYIIINMYISIILFNYKEIYDYIRDELQYMNT